MTTELATPPTSAADIEQEIAGLEARRAQLSEAHSTPPIVGQTDFMARRAGLDEITAIDVDLVELRGMLQEAQAREAHQATIARLVELAGQGAAALREVERASQAFDKAITPLIERYSDARQRHSDARQQFYQLLGKLDPAEVEAAGADLSWLVNLSAGRDRPHDRAYSEPARRFPGALSTAMREEAANRLGHGQFDYVTSLPPKGESN